MSFLSPLFLWLLPLSLLPLIIHLLNRRNIITVNFSSIRFLKIIENESIQRIQFIQILLLIIRTLIIIFIILMITRPTIKDSNSSYINDISSVHVIILDDSFSMTGKNDIARNTINKLLNQIPNNSQLLWINKVNGLQYNGLKQNIKDIDKYIINTYLKGSLLNSLNILNDELNNNNSNCILYVITDTHNQELSKINNYYNELKSYYTFFIPSNQFNDNLSIFNAEIKNEIFLPNSPITLDVEIQNNGIVNKENVLLQLIINDMIVGQQLISLKADSKETFTFNTSVPNYGSHNIKIELEEDDKLEDNNYFLNIYIPNKINIAILGDNENDIFYFNEAIKTLNNFGENIIVTDYNNIQKLLLNINNYNHIFIFNLKNLNFINDSKVEEYLFNGGHIAIFPNDSTEPSEYNNLNFISSEIIDNYNISKKNVLNNNFFQQIDKNSISNISIKNILSINNSDKNNIKFFKYIPLPLSTTDTQIQLEDGSSVWNRYKLQSGIIDVFGFAIKLNWTNLPIKGSFIPLNHYLIHSNNRNKYKSFYNTGDNWLHTSSEYFLNTVYHLKPNNNKSIIVQNSNNSFDIKSLNSPGYHYIISNKKTISEIAVNTLQNELYTFNINIDKIKNNLPEFVNIIKINDSMITNIQKVKLGQELWRILLYIILTLLILEMYISNRSAKS